MQFFKVNKALFVLIVVVGILAACNRTSSENKPHGEPIEMNNEEKASLIISQSFAALNSNLKSQMTQNGVEGAIEFCNLNANEIVDSLSNFYNASIKRTSFQLRNEDNAPTEDEIENLHFYTLGIEQEVEFSDQILETDEFYKYYRPIFVMDACTKCHGKEGETLNAQAYNKIASLYPNDEATGYETGDLRGMWVVSFKK